MPRKSTIKIDIAKIDFTKMYINYQFKQNICLFLLSYNKDLWFLYDDLYKIVKQEDIDIIPKKEIVTHDKILAQYNIKYEDVPKMDNINKKTKFVKHAYFKKLDEIEMSKNVIVDDEIDEDDNELVKDITNEHSIVKQVNDININDIVKMFKYNDKEITVLNINSEFWFRAKEIADILGYTKHNQAIQNNIKAEQKKSYKELVSSSYLNLGSLSKSISKSKTHGQTMFINEQGLYKLIFKSNKPEAEAFTDWVSDILVQIRKHGSYSNQPTEQLIFKSFYDDNLISSYENKNTMYIGYVGIHNKEHIFKFGISERIFQRSIVEHTNTFTEFQLLYVRETDNNRLVEDKFMKELICRHLYRKIKINSHQQTELFTITQKYNYEDIAQLLDNLISTFVLPISKEHDMLIQNYDKELTKYDNEITRLREENNKLKSEHAEETKFLKAIILHDKEIITELSKKRK